MFDPMVWIVRGDMQEIQKEIYGWNESRRGPKFFAGIFDEVTAIREKLNLIDNMSAYTFNLIGEILSILDDLQNIDVDSYWSLSEYHQDDSIEEKVSAIDATINEIVYAEEKDAVRNLDDNYAEYKRQMSHDDDDSEDLSVYEAALIWSSNGRDEDYMFGYTEEELEEALD